MGMRAYLAFAILALATAKDRLLVILDSWAVKETHTQMFGHLAWNFDVTYTMLDDQVSLVEYGELEFEHVLLVAPSVSGTKSTTFQEKELTAFFDKGGNIVVFGDQLTKKYTRNLLVQFGVEALPQDNVLSDSEPLPQAYTLDSSVRQSVVASRSVFAPARRSVSDVRDPVVFRGLGLTLDKKNEHVFPILKASVTTRASDEGVSQKGSKITLVAGYQSLYNSRFGVSGSLDMCSDRFMAYSLQDGASANKQFCSDFLNWTFQKRGVLRASNIDHGLVDPEVIARTGNKHDYKEGDEVRFSVDVEELRDGEWHSYEGDDLFLEYVRMDPYYRLKMTKDAYTATYSASFRTPDQNGVFKYRIKHDVPGFTRLHIEEVAANRIFKHDEHGRFFLGLPQYTSVWALAAGTLLFSLVFAFTE